MFESLFAQTALFAVFMLGANYFFLQRKRADRLRISLIMTAIAAVIYFIVIWLWRG